MTDDRLAVRDADEQTGTLNRVRTGHVMYDEPTHAIRLPPAAGWQIAIAIALVIGGPYLFLRALVGPDLDDVVPKWQQVGFCSGLLLFVSAVVLRIYRNLRSNGDA